MTWPDSVHLTGLACDQVIDVADSTQCRPWIMKSSYLLASYPTSMLLHLPRSHRVHPWTENFLNFLSKLPHSIYEINYNNKHAAWHLSTIKLLSVQRQLDRPAARKTKNSASRTLLAGRVGQQGSPCLVYAPLSIVSPNTPTSAH